MAQAGLLLARGDDDGAEQILNQMPPQPAMFGLLAQLGMDYVRNFECQQALTNYEEMAKLDPSNQPLGALVVLNFQLGNIEAYDHWRREILRQFVPTTTNTVTAGYFARVCLLAPPSAEEEKMIGNLLGPSLSQSHPMVEAGLGEASLDYSQGRFADAKDALQTSMTSTAFSEYYSANERVWAAMMLAMAEYQLQQTNEARATFVNGLQLADAKMTKPGNDPGDDWVDWMLAHFAMRAAAEVMPDVIASNDTFAADVTEEPGWVTVLRQKGLKFSDSQLNDGSWSLDLSAQPFADLTLLRGAQISLLRLSHTSVSDLTVLRGMPLIELYLNQTKVADLAPLRHMPLTFLDISGTQVADLSPLRGLQLTYLKMNSCRNITDLTPLEGMSTLRMLILPQNATNIEVLRGLTKLTRIGFKNKSGSRDPDKTAAQFWADYERSQFEFKDLPAVLSRMGVKINGKTINGKELNLDGQSIADLSPLRGVELRKLQIEKTQVTDLTPLQGMPLESLSVSGTQVADLSPLRGMPLKNLRMTDCRNIVDLSPLAEMTTLETVILPPNATNIEVLRGLTKLARIGFKNDPAVHGPDKTAAGFWADYDKERASR